MSVLVAGLSHREVPLDVLERFSFDEGSLPKGLHDLTTREHVTEAVILSTCNRVEVYALVSGFHAGVGVVRQFLAEFHHVPASEFPSAFTARYEQDAVRHLFAVASGIESMVVGEPQILSQVREAFRVAVSEEAVGPVLDALMRRAIKVGRLARARTDIARSGATFAAAGAAIARDALGGLADRTVLVVGSGKMSDTSARTIAGEGARVLVAGRTRARSSALAKRIGGEEVEWPRLGEGLARADAVLSSTASRDPVFTWDMVAGAMDRRPERPLLMLDLAVPRDVEPAAARVAGVTLLDLDALREAVAPGEEQQEQVSRVREIIDAEVPRFLQWQRAHGLAPLLKTLHERAEGVRSRELGRAAARLADLGERKQEAVEALTRSIVSKLLHAPIAAVRTQAGSPEGEALARALRELFDLPEA
jgi:glutamyl-tRNA reductase